MPVFVNCEGNGSPNYCSSYKCCTPQSDVFALFYFAPREVLLNVTNELWEADVYNVMGVIKGSTHPGKLLNCTSIGNEHS